MVKTDTHCAALAHGEQRSAWRQGRAVIDGASLTRLHHFPPARMALCAIEISKSREGVGDGKVFMANPRLFGLDRAELFWRVGLAANMRQSRFSLSSRHRPSSCSCHTSPKFRPTAQKFRRRNIDEFWLSQIQGICDFRSAPCLGFHAPWPELATAPRCDDKRATRLKEGLVAMRSSRQRARGGG